MKFTSEFLIIMALFVLILLVGSSMAHNSTRELWETRLAFAQQKQKGTLTEYVEVLGQPKEISRVNCKQSSCTRAIWDIALTANPCWKRFTVILDEKTDEVFLSTVENLIHVSFGSLGPVCAATPAS